MDYGEITIDADSATLKGNLIVPEDASGLVLFVHGSGSSRLSPRNQAVAAVIRAASLGTLLFDLLTPQEEARDSLTAELRFDISFLAERLLSVMRWLRTRESLASLELGYFGASTGAAAALVASTKAQEVFAVVSRGGRPDLAWDALPRVRAPTLLIVGSLDEDVIALNRAAYERLQCEKQLTIIPGASHLFQEPGTLDQVARHATQWFHLHLAQPATTPAVR